MSLRLSPRVMLTSLPLWSRAHLSSVKVPTTTTVLSSRVDGMIVKCEKKRSKNKKTTIIIVPGCGRRAKHDEPWTWKRLGVTVRYLFSCFFVRRVLRTTREWFRDIHIQFSTDARKFLFGKEVVHNFVGKALFLCVKGILTLLFASIAICATQYLNIASTNSYDHLVKTKHIKSLCAPLLKTSEEKKVKTRTKIVLSSKQLEEALKEEAELGKSKEFPEIDSKLEKAEEKLHKRVKDGK